MMEKKAVLKLVAAGALLIGITWGSYHFFFAPKQPPLFQAKKPDRRTIVESIKATGYLEPEDLMKIGSIVQGIVYKLHVEENDVVKKGQLLAEIDDGKDDTSVRQTKANWLSAQASLTYAATHYERQKALYEAGHISKDLFEQMARDYHVAEQDVAAKKALYDQESILFARKKIVAPDNGLVISKESSEGETVALTSPATIIYTIAKDICKMKAKLEIDESTVGTLKEGMEAVLNFDSYPHRIFKGTVSLVSNAPIKKGNAVSYSATIHIDNSQLLFRPGMSVDAVITITEKENVLVVPSNLFRINTNALETIATALGYEYKPLSKQERKTTLEADHMKTIWIVREKSFVEQPISIGINDNAYYEVLSGLKETDLILTDLAEPNTMKEFFQKFFGKGLG